MIYRAILMGWESVGFEWEFLHVRLRFCSLDGMAIVVGAISSACSGHHFPKVGVPSNGAAGTWDANRENAHFLCLFMAM